MARRGENICKRSDGRWEARYRNGTKSDGKPKYSSVYGKTYAEAKSKLNEKRMQSNTIAVPKNLTFNNIFDIWFADIKLRVKISTYTTYKMKYDKHIRPFLGGIAYGSLTSGKLNEFVQIKLKEGLSPKYTADLAGISKSICRFAKKRFGYEDKSEFLVMPKGTSKEKALLNKNEQARLNKYLIDNPTASNIGILLCSATGIRIGELCALRWENINLEKRTLTVKNTVQRVKNLDGDTATKLSINSPKSVSSVREIPLPDFIIPILTEIKTDNNSYLLSGTNKIVEPRTMQYRFKRILTDLQLSDVSFHSLRHGFATNCVALGFDVKTLSEILGHSSVEITLNRYVHSSMERKAEFMKSVSALFSA